MRIDSLRHSILCQGNISTPSILPVSISSSTTSTKFSNYRLFLYFLLWPLYQTPCLAWTHPRPINYLGIIYPFNVGVLIPLTERKIWTPLIFVMWFPSCSQSSVAVPLPMRECDIGGSDPEGWWRRLPGYWPCGGHVVDYVGYSKPLLHLGDTIP